MLLSFSQPRYIVQRHSWCVKGFVQRDVIDLDQGCTHFSFAKVLSHWVFLAKVLMRQLSHCMVDIQGEML